MHTYFLFFLLSPIPAIITSTTDIGPEASIELCEEPSKSSTPVMEEESLPRAVLEEKNSSPRPVMDENMPSLKLDLEEKKSSSPLDIEHRTSSPTPVLEGKTRSPTLIIKDETSSPTPVIEGKTSLPTLVVEGETSSFPTPVGQEEKSSVPPLIVEKVVSPTQGKEDGKSTGSSPEIDIRLTPIIRQIQSPLTREHFDIEVVAFEKGLGSERDMISPDLLSSGQDIRDMYTKSEASRSVTDADSVGDPMLVKEDVDHSQEIMKHGEEVNISPELREPNAEELYNEEYARAEEEINQDVSQQEEGQEISIDMVVQSSIQELEELAGTGIGNNTDSKWIKSSTSPWALWEWLQQHVFWSFMGMVKNMLVNWVAHNR